MEQTVEFPSIEAFIQHLRAKSGIIGILQYGSRDFQDMSPGGDFDLNVILDANVLTDIPGLHFHIQSIPIDCGLISIDDLHQDEAPSDYHCVLLNSTILHDPTGDIQVLLQEIRQKWRLNTSPIKESEVAFARFIKQHIVDKFDQRVFNDEIYTRMFLSGNIFWLLEDYIKINELNPYDFKQALAIMREKDEACYDLFESYVMTHDVSEKMALTQKLNEAVLGKIGGPWKKNEILFHYNEEKDTYSKEERQKVIDLLF